MRTYFFSALIFFLSIGSSGFTQKQSSNWFFGNYAAIKFTDTAIISLDSTAMYTWEGSASISDENGNLLFYTDGVSVWNKNNIQMPNGDALYGDISATQSALIVPHPGNSDLYYVFTVDGATGQNGCRYSIVDMALNNGLGDVTEKNNLLFAPATEKLTGTYRANNDVWVIAHEWNTTNFYSYMVTDTGIEVTPVISSVGLTPYNLSSGYAGQLKVSPNGNKVATINANAGNIILMDFNDSTGTISSPVQIDSVYLGYGIEFSPDGSKLYVSTYSPMLYIYQYDLLANDIPSSKILIRVDSILGGGLQLGPDKKIYCARSDFFNGGTQYLGAINKPDVGGLQCDYVDSAVHITYGTCLLGLPNFIQLSNDLPTFVSEDDGELCLSKFFPNPASEEISLTYCSQRNIALQLDLYDLMGKNIGHFLLDANQNQITIPLDNYSNGIYFSVILAHDKIIQRGKFLIVR